jgi:cell division protein FtsB
MNKVTNSYFIDARLSAQRPASRAVALSVPGIVEEVSSSAAHGEMVRRGNFSVPSWVFFCMIMLATFGLCVTVTMRTHAEMRGAEQKHESVSSEVERLRETNDSLRREAERLRTDARAVEAAARARLNMVRAGEVVVPIN